ncbi:hypothetical protein J5N97_028562 [Dioscorea zingiberensis]|uniref:Uncharacterized protein n=1 Tax=Dioscorea zingiberensis TaxID=325984 RepID=A0A9D5BZ62_9LILI|nr:hypothetical protein J5N97_028562 [Dioscorea zingiberensis]
MPSYRRLSRINTVELKSQILKKLGSQKAEKYFYSLERLLSRKLSKLEFEKFVFSTIGKENVALHNLLIRAILHNACLRDVLPSKETVSGHSRNGRISNGQVGDSLSMSPRRGRSTGSRDRRSTNRPSPLGPHGKALPGSLQEVSNSCDPQRSREQQSTLEVISIGSKAPLEVASVEDGEEVEQVRGSPCVQSRSPVRAPLGITLSAGSCSRKALRISSTASSNFSMPYLQETCYSTSELPDMRSLKMRLEHKLESEGLGVSLECVNLLNSSLDVYLKGLIKPCIELARARRRSDSTGQIHRQNSSKFGVWQEQVQRSNQFYSASLQDFQVAMELNPRLLGVDWPEHLEKICLQPSEE